ncbi:hypothetical protein [Bacteroides thetaiotaomicron]|uniref:hypothetical protein n=1 Tax=Bacteroides thetaiotaomicron TaxID=818 RepID=UPI002165D0CC|nr:hypothetical protein [Bacteroides thetaiotaomicron]MCS3198260.1 hypothetical protein [Bacteroides thetaiotaomicron]
MPASNSPIELLDWHTPSGLSASNSPTELLDLPIPSGLPASNSSTELLDLPIPSELPASNSPPELLDWPIPSGLPASNSPTESTVTGSTGISGAIRKQSSEPLLSALGFFFMADCFSLSGCNKCSTSQLRCLGFICSPFARAFMDG